MDDNAISEAYREGYRAYLDDKQKSDNPYNTNDEFRLHRAWRNGFEDAGWDD